MSRSRDPRVELREVIEDRRAVLVAGTGVSIGATNGCAEASWGGLLRSGLGWLRDHKLIPEPKAQAHLSLMEDDAGTHHFLAAAQDITRLMGGQGSVHFKDWLEGTVGALAAEDRAVLDALDALRAHGNLLATTNYDSLLLGKDAALTPVTWREHDDFLDVARRRDNGSVLYLHGHWRTPESVVLDWSSYERIGRDDTHRADRDAFWHLSTWVYVGCGLNGLGDPDLGLLLDRYGRRLRTAGMWDYCLVRRCHHPAFQAYFKDHNLNIVAVPFGDAQDELAAFLGSLLTPATPAAAVAPASPSRAPVGGPPVAPALYALPQYVGTHDFVGRESQLRDLDDWARAADPTNLLLFEAIGGSGKSILTWRWVNDSAPLVRSDWAGRFWYSFYERGAVMAHFCRHALAYMTGKPVRAFKDLTIDELVPSLLTELQAKPWLVVLDGLERVLVAYHRIDAAELPDEALDRPTDEILDRGPTSTIRDEDGDLLRLLAGARPSKILVTSRLTPRVLLNQGDQPIPGVKRQPLGGLRPDDAEAMFRAGGARGDSDRIQRYLTENCDNHPLVVGVLAGLVAKYLPARGDFTAWLADGGPNGGGRLDLADLDLIQRRNHILRAAIDDLSPESRDLLSLLALHPEAVDYEMLAALNPFLPAQPEEVPEPTRPEDVWSWQDLGDDRRAQLQSRYEKELVPYRNYQRELAEWRQSAVVAEAAPKLAEAVRDLEQRGLLLYDPVARRHDLHPVVRAVASRRIRPDDLERHGQRLVDYFTSAAHTPYEEAATLDDVAPALRLVRILVKLGRSEQAARTLFSSGLVASLFHNLEAYVDVIALLRPFFGRGWGAPVTERVGPMSAVLSNDAGVALSQLREYRSSIAAHGVSLAQNLERRNWAGVNCSLRNLAVDIEATDALASSLRLTTLALRLASVSGAGDAHVFLSRFRMFSAQNRLGWWDDAAETWEVLDGMGRTWPREFYVPGSLELEFATGRLYQGLLREDDLEAVVEGAEQSRSRWVLREMYRVRGMWRLECEEWVRAAQSLHEALHMARERRFTDPLAEAGLVLANVHLGRLTKEDARQETLRLAATADPPHRLLAMLWLALGDTDRATTSALRAYEQSWGDGEPYVYRYPLTKSAELLDVLGVPLPDLPPYDLASDAPLPFEAEVEAMIEQLAARAAESADP